MDQRVKKRVLHAGRGSLPPFADGDRVKFHFRSETTDEEPVLLDDSRKYKPMELILGKQFKLEVLEACVKTMLLGEVAEFTIDKALLHAYPIVAKTLRAAWDPAHKPPPTASGCCGMMMAAQQPQLGYPDLDGLLQRPQNLRIVIELLSAEAKSDYERESWALNEQEKLASVTELRERGNALYRDGKHEAAAEKYADALGRLESLMLREKPQDVEWNKLNELKLPLLLNFAQCKLLEDDYYAAIEHCSTVLEARPDDVKALFRRGRARARVWETEAARADLNRAAELDPSVAAAVRRELAALAAREKEKLAEEKEQLRGKIFT
ncbi:AH receptor-interacting protein [Amphibalanus amphitrite]|uniref:AH receptor-interacting protein n=1 Tax=Amphibalanus amphitrite TaxID=1232801 RepID=A0A6A4VRY9_AMPAM|nr:AH receptor-interacting protein [Amphibalanus amphitrite]